MTPKSNVPNWEHLKKISHSELYALTRCSKMHDYAYRQGLSPATPASYLTEGKFLHLIQEQLFKSLQEGAAPGEVQGAVAVVAADLCARLPELADVTPEARAGIVKVLEGYWKTAERDLEGVTVEAVEEEVLLDVGLKTPDGEPVLLHAVLDLVLYDQEGQLWLGEHKKVGRAWSQGNFLFDRQGPLYSVVLETLYGQFPAGVLYNFYLPNRFERRFVTLTPEHAYSVLTEVQNAVYLRESGHVMRQPHWGCGDCAFKDLCFAEMQGQDTQLLRETRFVVDEQKAARFDDD